MDRGIARTELNHLRADLGDEAAVGRATGGGQFGGDAGFSVNRLHQRIRQRAARGQERLAAQIPVQVIFQAVLVQHRMHARLQAFRRAGRRESEVEQRHGFARHHVGGARARIQVRHLERRGREVLVALVPFDADNLGQRRRQLVHRVACQVRVRHVALDALYRQLARQGATAAVLAGVAQYIAGSRLAHDAVIQLFAARLQGVANDGGTVDGRTFFVRRDQQRDGTAMLGVGGHEFLGRHHEGSDRAFHVGRPTAVQPAVAFGGYERVAIPLFARTRRHHIRVTGKHGQRRGAAAPGPQIGDAALCDGFAREADALQPGGKRRLAIFIRRGDRRTGDQVLDQIQYGRRAHYALSRSLMLVLARVCASTRLTMTAQARLCEPSADGSEPGTTTEPEGTRPYMILPVARS